MARPRKTITTDGEGAAIVTPIDAAADTLKKANAAYLKAPTAPNYNAMMFAARQYQNVYRSQFVSESE